MKNHAIAFNVGVAIIAVLSLNVATSFVPQSTMTFRPASQKLDIRKVGRSSALLIQEKVDDTAEPQPTGNQEIEPPSITLSLEEKMKNWEASEEEIKAATLGGPLGHQGTWCCRCDPH